MQLTIAADGVNNGAMITAAIKKVNWLVFIAVTLLR